MARVTVEDCIDKVDSPYELVLVAKERATQLNSGIEPTLDRDNDKHTVIALREIAEETIKVPDLTEAAVYKLENMLNKLMTQTRKMKKLEMISKIYIRVKFLKVVYQFYPLKELGRFQKKSKFQKKILPNYHHQHSQMLMLMPQAKLKKAMMFH